MVAAGLVGSKSGAKVAKNACDSCPLATVFVCRKCDGSDRVVAFLAKNTRADIKTVRCQKVCKGPVAAVAIRGRMEYFGRLNKKKRLQALKRLVNTSARKKIPKPLRKTMSHERSGFRPR
ncbi:MAG TPA: hypothetical protein VHJ78_08830 [Actinomycetota bacterium]|nr:hypothetical protein [Actinomycetota bacterium]